ncbi:MAG TPA: TlpA disulfide reductase family protein [Solirubrobacteraceae bacterium]|nr:TlpA disulfide reductase family protein [Solirubrobacteraceae bacterium]
MKRVLGPAITVAVALAAVGLFVFGLHNQGASRALDNAVADGQRPAAPDRTLPMLGAPGSRSLANYRGKVVVLNFWASWCDPCAAESPLLETAERQLAATGQGTVLGVTYKDFTSDSLAFIRTHGLTYPSLRDSTGALANAFGTEALPETFVLDRDSRVVAISRGQILRQSFLTQAIAKAEKA